MQRLILTAAAMAIATPALAVGTLSLGGIALAGQGLVSNRAVPLINERFNSASTPGTCVRQTGNSPNDPNTDPVAGYNIAALLNQQYALVAGSTVDRNLAPLNNSSCYFVTPRRTRNAVSDVRFRIRPASGDVQYFGFYWGSIDPYNIFGAFDEFLEPIQIEGFTDIDGDPRNITGQEIIDRFGIPAFSSIYLEVRFLPSDNFFGFRMGSTNWAMETDNWAFATTAVPTSGSVSIKRPKSNISNGVLAVPAPATAALMLGGLALVAAARARRK